MEHHRDAAWLMFTWDGVGLGGRWHVMGRRGAAWAAGAWRRAAACSRSGFRAESGPDASRGVPGAALCWESGIHDQPVEPIPSLLKKAWEKGLNAPVTTAVGRFLTGPQACWAGRPGKL